LPAKDGVQVDIQDLKNKVLESLVNLESGEQKQISLDIPVTTTPPSVTTGEVNSLGIKRLIGRGTSKFAGSIASRIHNVFLASSKFNGVLVPPGSTFSFNKTLGDVSAYTGYKQAYIIKDGKTILGDGGGVCQVSTTLFRAVLNAGLPIIERRAHSYQ
jgi:vancomycin resistance protein YoaR